MTALGLKVKDKKTTSAEFEKISEKKGLKGDRSLIPQGLKIEDTLVSDVDAKERWKFRYELYRDFLREARDVAEKYSKSDESRLARLEILNRLQDAVNDGTTNSVLNKLFKHQLAAFSDLLDFLEAGKNNGWIKMPTGAGKTAIFCALAGITGVKTLILVPKNNLIKQTRRALKKFAGSDLKVTSFYGKNKDTSGDVVICTYQSIGKLVASGVNFPLVIGDEMHRGLSKRRRDHMAAIPGKIIQLGLSATPKFNESKSLDMIGECIHELPIVDAIKANIISGAKVILAKTKTNISGVKVMPGTGDYSRKDLGKVINTPARNEAIVRLLEQPLVGNSTTVISCVNKAHAEGLAELALKKGLKASFVHSGLSDEENEKRREQLDKGEIQFLFFVDQLTEGWDCPRAEILVNARPTRSIVNAEQRGGRVLRNHTFEDGREKAYGLIIEVVDEGDRPVLMSDILGGTFVLPESVEEEYKKKYANKEAIEADGIEGLEVIVEMEEIMRTLEALSKNIESSRNLLKVTRKFASEVINATYSSPEEMRTASNFLRSDMTHPLFTSNGAALVRGYYRDTKHIELMRVTKEHLHTMLDEIQISKPMKKSGMLIDTAEKVRKILAEAGVTDEILTDYDLFRECKIDTEDHRGSGNSLIRNFFLDRDGIKPYVNRERYEEFLNILGVEVVSVVRPVYQKEQLKERFLNSGINPARGLMEGLAPARCKIMGLLPETFAKRYKNGELKIEGFDENQFNHPLLQESYWQDQNMRLFTAVVSYAFDIDPEDVITAGLGKRVFTTEEFCELFFLDISESKEHEVIKCDDIPWDNNPRLNDRLYNKTVQMMLTEEFPGIPRTKFFKYFFPEYEITEPKTLKERLTTNSNKFTTHELFKSFAYGVLSKKSEEVKKELFKRILSESFPSLEISYRDFNRARMNLAKILPATLEVMENSTISWGSDFLATGKFIMRALSIRPEEFDRLVLEIKSESEAKNLKAIGTYREELSAQIAVEASLGEAQKSEVIENFMPGTKIIFRHKDSEDPFRSGEYTKKRPFEASKIEAKIDGRIENLDLSEEFFNTHEGYVDILTESGETKRLSFERWWQIMITYF